MKDCRFEKGDYVIYGIKGICCVEDVKMMSLSPEMPERPYYILRQEENRDLVMSVPADNKKLVAKMRHVLTKPQIDSLLESARGSELMWIDDKRERTERFGEILATGVQKELLLMISCIYLQKQELHTKNKKLNVSDDSTLKAAVKLVREEFAYALGIDPDDVGAYIRRALSLPDTGDEY